MKVEDEDDYDDEEDNNEDESEDPNQSPERRNLLHLEPKYWGNIWIQDEECIVREPKLGQYF